MQIEKYSLQNQIIKKSAVEEANVIDLIYIVNMYVIQRLATCI